MAQDKKPTFEEVKAMVGQTKEDVIQIDKSMLRLYCQAIGETDPKYLEVAHPGFLTSAMMSSGATALGTPMPYNRIVAAGGQWDYFKPIKVGDTITTIHEFHDMQDKGSPEKGPKAFLIFKSTHKNQNGEVVAVSTGNVMNY